MVTVATISQQIWDMKYRLRGPTGEPVDKTIEDTWRRVARALAAVEKDLDFWAERFYAAMDDFRFLPAGRVIAGAGAERQVTLFNCFVMGTIPDDMGGIFAHLREAALTMQQGGGIGYDFSTLRPHGAYVKGVGADASGPLSFMDVWDAMCRTIMSAGYRRGAMMATMLRVRFRSSCTRHSTISSRQWSAGSVSPEYSIFSRCSMMCSQSDWQACSSLRPKSSISSAMRS